MSATTQFAGTTWLQRAFDGTNSQGVKITIVYLIATHQTGSTSQFFFIGYVAPLDSFDQTNTDYFQPMMQSFAFTSK